jgi:non-ribosomal peptide synthetase component F
LLAKELMILYQTQIDNKPNPLPRLKIQFKDYAEWENSKEFQSRIKKQEKYWLKKFKGVNPFLVLPTDKLRPKRPLYRGGNIKIDLAPGFSKKITEFSRKNEITIFNFLLAVFAVFLNKLSGENQIPIGTLINNRREKEQANVFGIFFNSMPFLVKINSNNRFEELLKSVRQELLDVMDNSEYPFNSLAKKIKPFYDASQPSLFNVMFQENDFFIEEEAKEIKMTRLWVPTDTSKIDFKINLNIENKKMRLMAEYDPDLFLPETIQKWLEYYINLVKQTVVNANIKVSDLNLLSKEEKQKINKLSKIDRTKN